MLLVLVHTSMGGGGVVMGVRCIARREGDSLSCATANLVPFHQL